MLVTVANFTEPAEAHFFRLRLQAEGIPAVVAHENHVWASWPHATALGGVKVQVLEAMREEARAVEDRVRAGEYRAELAAHFGGLEEPRCPRCGAGDPRRRRSLPRVAVLLALFAVGGAIFPLRASLCRCTACGATWRDGDGSPDVP